MESTPWKVSKGYIYCRRNIDWLPTLKRQWERDVASTITLGVLVKCQIEILEMNNGCGRSPGEADGVFSNPGVNENRRVTTRGII